MCGPWEEARDGSGMHPSATSVASMEARGVRKGADHEGRDEYEGGKEARRDDHKAEASPDEYRVVADGLCENGDAGAGAEGVVDDSDPHQSKSPRRETASQPARTASSSAG